MELVKPGQTGQLTLPRAVLRAAGAYPLENYSVERIAEFEHHKQIPDDLADRAEALFAKTSTHNP